MIGTHASIALPGSAPKKPFCVTPKTQKGRLSSVTLLPATGVKLLPADETRGHKEGNFFDPFDARIGQAEQARMTSLSTTRVNRSSEFTARRPP